MLPPIVTTYSPVTDQPLRCVARAMAATLVIAITGMIVVGFAPRPMCRGGSKEQVAQITVKAFAFEAFPGWSIAHPDATCPDQFVPARP